ncbi:helix-turn-helix domain-containing protein [Gracilibacillus alcaliphilus]|uniref:helix-turn-helix domain-containing protein n=1 Tax=Gracilibacillus alcaliphilus TaxID=1401441 RepID=UPI0019577AAC|nr:helix-turn-helix domain-containing protein [Gracilibacillus alcaliphilus]MBM7676980.1 transposase-like protein [Gracilibacillus alcaliphilus]
MKTYSYEMKKQVVEKYFEGHAIRDLVQAYPISDERVARRWVQKVREGGYEALMRKGQTARKRRKENLEKKAKKKELTKDEIIEHQALQIELLKKLLELERK